MLGTTGLLPCPFCGGEAKYDNSDRGPYEWIACRQCGARGASSDYNDGGPDARERWNQRVAPTPTSES